MLKGSLLYFTQTVHSSPHAEAYRELVPPNDTVTPKWTSSISSFLGTGMDIGSPSSFRAE